MNTKRTSLYLPTEIEQKMKQLAHEHNRSLNSEIIQACKAWIEQYNRPDKQFWKGIDTQGNHIPERD